MDLSKAFDSISQALLSAKLEVYVKVSNKLRL